MLASVYALLSDHHLSTLFLGHGRNKEQFSHALEVAPLSANLFDKIIIHCGGAYAAKRYLELTVRFRSFSHSKVQCTILQSLVRAVSYPVTFERLSMSPRLLDMAPVKEIW